MDPLLEIGGDDAIVKYDWCSVNFKIDGYVERSGPG